MKRRIATTLAILAAAVLVMANCHKGDRIAPEGSTIDLAALPTTVVLIGGTGSSTIVATVSSVAGVPLPDQDVRFTSTAGSLYDDKDLPAANIPIRTDSYGNAHVTLVTSKTTTVNARSGKATGSLTLDTVPGDLSTILLNQDFTSSGCLTDSTITACGQVICLVAQAVDAGGAPVAGVVLKFKLQNTFTEDNSDLAGVFLPQTGTTDAAGEVRSGFTLSSSCAAQCGGSKLCSGEIVATLTGGSFPSTPVTFNTSIP